MSSLREMKIAELKKSMELWMAQYTAVNKQLRLEMNPMTKTTLQAQLDELETQIETAELELANLENGGASAAPAVSPASGSDIKQQLYDVLNEYYKVSELHDLIFEDLGLEHEVVIGTYKTRKELARELIGYCYRHGRLDELTAIVKAARPHAWK